MITNGCVSAAGYSAWLQLPRFMAYASDRPMFVAVGGPPIGGPPRAMHFAKWKISVAVAGGLLGILLLAALALYLWKRKRPAKLLQVSPVLLLQESITFTSSSSAVRQLAV